MGVIEFFGVVVLIAVVAAVANWILTQVPGVPAVVPRIIWVVAVLVILWVLLSATGLLGHDVRIPHV